MQKSAFLNVLDEIIEEEPGFLEGDETLTDLEGWDSLSVVSFIGAADKHFGIAVAPKELLQATSINDLLGLVADGLTD